jgi:Na+/H+-translocating membrane pyrophosphatase
VGFAFGTKILAGLILGVIVSGVQMAVGVVNSGGAWNSAEEYVEAGLMLDG